MITIDQVFHVATAVIAAASALAPALPHPDKVEGVVKVITKVVNFLALNYDKLVTFSETINKQSK